jgi:hypothetical protein
MELSWGLAESGVRRSSLFWGVWQESGDVFTLNLLQKSIVVLMRFAMIMLQQTALLFNTKMVGGSYAVAMVTATTKIMSRQQQLHPTKEVATVLPT